LRVPTLIIQNMNNETYQQVFDLAQEINDHDSFLIISVLAIDSRLCTLEIQAKRKSGSYSKNETIVSDNLTYKESLLLLKGLSYGRFLPT
jgi:hypothetical protein